MVYKDTLPNLPPAQCAAVQRSLQQWLGGDGARLLAQERRSLRQLLPVAAGNYVAQIGMADIAWLADDAGMRQVRLDISEAEDVPHAPRRLPLSGDSIDIAVIPHSLESLVQPELLLREVLRVLVPGGNIFIFLLAGSGKSPLLFSPATMSLARLRSALGLMDCVIVHRQKVLAVDNASRLQQIWPRLANSAWSWFIHASHRPPAVMTMPQSRMLQHDGRADADPALSAGRSQW